MNLETVRRIADAVAVPDPGRRRAARRRVRGERARGRGVEHVVIGTAALRDPEFLDAMLKEHGERIVVSVDARDGKVSLAGLDRDLRRRGGRRGRRPDRARGRSASSSRRSRSTARWPGRASTQLAKVAAATSASVIYSGGVGTLDDLERLRAEAAPNVDGVIVGRALYEGRFTVDEAVAALA